MCSLYGFKRETRINRVRYLKLIKKAGSEGGELRPGADFDLGGTPPCRSVLLQHSKRVNYQIKICKLAHIANQHRWIKINDCLETLWSEDNIMPATLVDFLEESNEEDNDQEQEEEEDKDIESDESEDDEGE